MTVSNRSKQMSSMDEVAWLEEPVLRVVTQWIDCAILLAGFAGDHHASRTLWTPINSGGTWAFGLGILKILKMLR